MLRSAFGLPHETLTRFRRSFEANDVVAVRACLKVADESTGGEGCYGVETWAWKLVNSRLSRYTSDTPMTTAASTGRNEMTELLLEYGAVIDAVDGWGGTPLRTASVFGQVATVRLLLERGAKHTARKEDGKTALHMAASHSEPGVLDCLLEAGVEVDETDFDGRTALSYVGSRGNVASGRVLVRKGASLDKKDRRGKTPLHWACQSLEDNRAAVVEFLLDRGAHGDARDRRGWTPLHCVAYRGFGRAGRLLVEAGASVNLTDGFDSTPLHMAVKQRDVGEEDETLDVVRTLLGRGAQTEVEDVRGWSPLFWAASYGNYRAVQLLLEAGASVTARDGDGSTPLHEACKHQLPSNRKTVRLLLEANADVTAVADDGATPLMVHRHHCRPGCSRFRLLDYERQELHRHDNCPAGLWAVLMSKCHANVPCALGGREGEIDLFYRTLCGKPDFFAGRAHLRKSERKRKRPLRLVAGGNDREARKKQRG